MPSARYIIKNCVIITGSGAVIPDGALFIDGGIIKFVGSSAEVDGWRRDFDDVDVVDVDGRIAMPPLMNPHHHLYSSLAVGLSPKGETSTFKDILKALWWRLDAILDEESVFTSAMVGLVECVRSGVTFIFDHHASMNFVRGSLSAIEEAFKTAGVSGVLCFEISNRTGKRRAMEHIRENISFFESHRSDDRIKGAMGLHANFTIDEDLMRAVSQSKPDDMPIHIHCGEDACDLDFCKSIGYQGPVDRLSSFGLLNETSILAHCIHLSERDYQLIDEIEPIVVWNPESNANNRVGQMNRKRIKNYLIGTDGMTSDIIATLRSAYLLGTRDGITLDELLLAAFKRRYDVQRAFFPGTGEIKRGRAANVVVFDYIPKTPISSENLIAHLIFGARCGRAFITISCGKPILWKGEIKFIDEEELFQKAKRISEDIFKKF